jgi:hypothetical protein
MRQLHELKKGRDEEAVAYLKLSSGGYNPMTNAGCPNKKTNEETPEHACGTYE